MEAINLELPLAFILILGDIINTQDLRRLVYSFLLTKRNLKSAKKIHLSQTKKEQFTLSYIGKHAIHQKEFWFFQKTRMLYIYCIIPQYLLLLIVYIFSATASIIIAIAIALIKVIFGLCLRSQFDLGGWISRFDKRAK